MDQSLWSLDCPKSEFFAILCCLSKKPKTVKAIYIYAPEISHYTLSENDIVYGGLKHRS